MPPTTRKRTLHQKAKKNQASSSVQPPLRNIITSGQRFISEEAKDRFVEMRGFEFAGERRFDVVNLTHYPMFETMIRERGWEKLNDMVADKCNRTVGLEFLANARVSTRKYIYFCSDKEIDFSLDAINALLGLQPPEVCDVKKRRSEATKMTREEWDALLLELGREGARWRGPAGKFPPQRINTTDLKLIPKAWASFITSTLESTSCTSELPLKKVFTLVAIMSGNPINVGELMAENLNEMAKGELTVMGHGCLINLLCEAKGILGVRSDLETHSKGPINDKALQFYEKLHDNYLRDLAEKVGRRQQDEQPREVVAEPRQQPHSTGGESSNQMHQLQQMQRRMDAFMFGVAHWMNDTSAYLYVDPPYFPHHMMKRLTCTVRSLEDLIRGLAQRRR